MSLLSDAKTALRITSTAYDDEIGSLISAAIDDLKGAGVTAEAAGGESPLVHRAIMTYCKAHFGWGNEDFERLEKAYEMQKIHLSLNADYAQYTVTFYIANTLGVDIRQATVVFDGETKITGASGSVTFYKRPGNNYRFSVHADGYTADDDDNNLVDVVGSAAIVMIVLT